ncbi:hypothetical protein FOCC_FOCC004147 [Frankliniella occidentalis]|nr:hypothetical protein FOCC_FOCC004147 [Frankliniella occidentalis]
MHPGAGALQSQGLIENNRREDRYFFRRKPLPTQCIQALSQSLQGSTPEETTFNCICLYLDFLFCIEGLII